MLNERLLAVVAAGREYPETSFHVVERVVSEDVHLVDRGEVPLSLADIDPFTDFLRGPPHTVGA